MWFCCIPGQFLKFLVPCLPIFKRGSEKNPFRDVPSYKIHECLKRNKHRKRAMCLLPIYIISRSLKDAVGACKINRYHMMSGETV